MQTKLMHNVPFILWKQRHYQVDIMTNTKQINGLFSTITWASQYQKGKTSLD